ncbi:MAG: DUF1501 domain-containing protein [Bryobacteraceae bacterium]|nr:DUF1501 domain-containing protein [Bryobacteraceae bacterium]
MKHLVDPLPTDRRGFLRSMGGGFGSIAMAAMASQQAAAELLNNPMAPRRTHFPAKAKRVILLWMQGGPSQMDLFDFKPRLKSEAGNPVPFKLNSATERYEQSARLMPSVSEFKQVGHNGMWMSDLMPGLATKVSELSFLRAMQTDSPAHPGAIRIFQSGSLQFVRPSIGSWIVYGLGTENQNLPGFVVISPMLYGDDGSPLDYSNVFLPAIYQGTRLGDARTPVKNSRIGYLGDPDLQTGLQRQHLDLIQARNRMDQDTSGADSNVEGLIQSYELAFRMQMAAPEVFDIKNESKSTLDLYGVGEADTDNFGRKCLLARRLAEAGVRYIQVTDNGWDHHTKIGSLLRKSAKGIDKPVTGLLTDLKARGLLEDTLVIWTGEFGRTPYDQSAAGAKDDTPGRDHNPYCWTMWMAGAGIKQGMIFGETDEYAWKAVDGKVHVHDLHATILHLLGLDHERLTYRYSGRDFRLTDVYGRVVKEILA